jgi:hypothetical protein
MVLIFFSDLKEFPIGSFYVHLFQFKKSNNFYFAITIMYIHQHPFVSHIIFISIKVFLIQFFKLGYQAELKLWLVPLYHYIFILFLVQTKLPVGQLVELIVVIFRVP